MTKLVRRLANHDVRLHAHDAYKNYLNEMLPHEPVHVLNKLSSLPRP